MGRPSGTQLPRLSDGFPHTLGLPHSPTGGPAAALGPVQGRPLKPGAQARALNDKDSLFPPPRGGGFLWFLPPPNGKLWSGEVPISCSFTPSRGRAEPLRHPQRRHTGGEPGVVAVRGKASNQPSQDGGCRARVGSPIHLCGCAGVAAGGGAHIEVLPCSSGHERSTQKGAEGVGLHPGPATALCGDSALRASASLVGKMGWW